MKYSYEFKKEYVQLYREGKWPNTPEDSKEKNFHDSIRTWFKLEELHGPEILKHGNNINWTPDEKLEIVSKVLAGNSIKSIAIEYAINDGQLYWWVNKYKIMDIMVLLIKRDRLERRTLRCVTQGEKEAIVKELKEKRYKLKYLLIAIDMPRSTYYFEINKVDKIKIKNSHIADKIT